MVFRLVVRLAIYRLSKSPFQDYFPNISQFSFSQPFTLLEDDANKPRSTCGKVKSLGLLLKRDKLQPRTIILRHLAVFPFSPLQF